MSTPPVLVMTVTVTVTVTGDKVTRLIRSLSLSHMGRYEGERKKETWRTRDAETNPNTTNKKLRLWISGESATVTRWSGPSTTQS